MGRAGNLPRGILCVFAAAPREFVCVSGLPLASCRPTEPAMELSTVKRGTWNERDRVRGRERRVASVKGAWLEGARGVTARSTHFLTGLYLQALHSFY